MSPKQKVLYEAREVKINFTRINNIKNQAVTKSTTA
jgi:hypothetical protein